MVEQKACDTGSCYRTYMTHRTYLCVLLVGFSLFVGGCGRTSNHERAYFTKAGSKYLIEMKGDRRRMAHDPWSAIVNGTYEETLTLELPRIEGVIQGSEIPAPPRKLGYTGTVSITGNKMKVDLRYDGSDRQSLDWNGEYTLVPRE